MNNNQEENLMNNSINNELNQEENNNSNIINENIDNHLFFNINPDEINLMLSSDADACFSPINPENDDIKPNNDQLELSKEPENQTVDEDDFMNADQDVKYDSDVPDIPLSSSDSDSDSVDSVNPDDLEDFDEGPKPTKPILSEHEAKTLLPPELPSETLPSDTPIHPLGAVYSKTNMNSTTTTIVIKSSPQFRHFALDLDSTLVLSDMTVVGTVFETFGPVYDPWYSVLVHTDRAHQFVEGTEIFFVLNLSKPVEIQELRKIKGSDASNLYDEEIAEHEMEFSDDEQEQLYRKHKKMERKMKNSNPPSGNRNQQPPPPNNDQEDSKQDQQSQGGRPMRVYDY